MSVDVDRAARSPSRTRAPRSSSRCDVIAGCDGFHGICREAIADELTVYERVYPFAWLGILARSKPSSEELIYSNHARGFALHSHALPVGHAAPTCRSRPTRTSTSGPTSASGRSCNARFELDGGFSLNEGEIFEKGITPMRAFVVEPMQHEHLYLAGDAAHIVPPTGAKGMNLAIADVEILASALEAFSASGDTVAARVVLRALPPARVARAALLVLHDVDAPPARRPGPVRGAAPAGAAGVRVQLGGGGADRWRRTTWGSTRSRARRPTRRRPAGDR